MIKPDGTKMYHRKYRKQTKKWDVTPVLESKKYEYIPELIECVHLMRIQSAVALRHKEILAENHPARRQVTIAHTAPTPTDELIRSKRSRFY